MAKKTNDVDMLTFQPFGEETLMENEERVKKATKNAQPDVKKIVEKKVRSVNEPSKTKNDALKGVMIGVVVAMLFICYDIFLH